MAPKAKTLFTAIFSPALGAVVDGEGEPEGEVGVLEAAFEAPEPVVGRIPVVRVVPPPVVDGVVPLVPLDVAAGLLPERVKEILLVVVAEPVGVPTLAHWALCNWRAACCSSAVQCATRQAVASA